MAEVEKVVKVPMTKEERNARQREKNRIKSDLRWKIVAAVDKNDLEAVKSLLAEGADINASEGLGNTLIIMAMWRRFFEMAELLFEAGADINHENYSGKSALGLAQFFKSHTELATRMEAQNKANNYVDKSHLDFVRIMNESNKELEENVDKYGDR